MSPTPTFWTALAGKLVLDVTSGLLKAAAAAVRRRLSSPEMQKALQGSVQEALESSLRDLLLDEELKGHYEDLLRACFAQEAVLEELAQLIDPRPGCEIDFAALARKVEEGGGIDREYLVGFDLETFLRSFAGAFYSAAGSRSELRANLQLKVLGEILLRSGVTAEASLRTADATETLVTEVKQVRGLLERFLDVGASAQELLEAAGRVHGFLPAFQAYESFAAGLLRAGYALGVDVAGRVEIAVDPDRPRALPAAGVEALQTVAAGFREQIFRQVPGPEERKALEERFRLHVVRWFESLTFQGLMRSPKPIVLPLEEVYIELRAVAEVPEAADAFSVEERLLLLEVDEADLPGRRELTRQLDALRRERWSRTLPERKRIGEALLQRDRRAFVILGDPGSGKTTLLHFLALVYARGPEAAAGRLGIDSAEADRLPIFVPLAAYDDMLREVPGLTLLEFLPRYYDRRRGLPGLEPLFRQALESGRALVLLDGLDEVLDSSTRRHVSEQAAVFLSTWTPRGVRFAISSRFVGYREAPLPGNVPTLSVLDFGQPEIELFARRWAQAYERWAAGGESPEMLRQAQSLETDLLDDVRSNESVRRLAANPLMLTMLALLRRQVGKLPHRRVQLYESYLGTLLDNWIELRTGGERLGSGDHKLDRLKLENLLIPFALWLHRSRPSGTAGRAEVQRELAEICLRDAGVVPGEASVPQQRSAEERAAAFLRDMRQMTGLIIERGHDAIGFLHLTFQEYFAGRALALLPAEKRWETLRPHLHDPRWREPLLLCAGRLGVVENRRPEVTDLVRRILDHEDATEEHLHRNLLLALAIAGDDVNLDPGLMEDLVSRAVRCLYETRVPSFAAALAGSLGQLVANGAAQAEACFGRLRRSAGYFIDMPVIEALSRFATVPQIREMLVARLKEEKDQWLLRPLLKALERQIGSDADVRKAVLARLEAPEPEIRAAVLGSLSGYVGTDGEIRRAALAGLADRHFSVRAASLRALSSLVGIEEEVRRAALVGLKEEGSGVHSAALDALSVMFDTDYEVRQTFLDGFGEGYDRRLRTLQAMAGRVTTDDEIRGRVEALLDDNESTIRFRAARALSPVLEVRQDLRDRLIEGLQGHSNEDDCLAALQALAPWAATDESVAAAVTGVCGRTEWSIRQIAAEVLGENQDLRDASPLIVRISRDLSAPESERLVSLSLSMLTRAGQGSGRVRAYLWEALDHTSLEIRSSALRAVARFIRTDGEIRRRVLRSLEDEDTEIRGTVLAALSDHVGTDEEIRCKVLEGLKDKAASVCAQALASLSSYVSTDKAIRAKVLEGLKDEHYLVHEAALIALSDHAGTDREIRAKVLEGLKDPWPWIRASALRALSSCVATDKKIRDVVLRARMDEDVNIRAAALSALSGCVTTDGEIRRVVMESLEDKDSNVRAAAVGAIGNLFDMDEDTRFSLFDRFRRDDFSVRLACLRGICLPGMAPSGRIF